MSTPHTRPRIVSYNQEQFARLVAKEMGKSFGLSPSEAIQSVEFTNNTVVIKIADKRVVQGEQRRAAARKMRSSNVSGIQGRG